MRNREKCTECKKKLRPAEIRWGLENRRGVWILVHDKGQSHPMHLECANRKGITLQRTEGK